MVRHVVMFSLADAPEKAAVMQRFKEAIEALPQAIGWIRRVSVDFNANPDEEYDLVLVGDFDTLDDVRRYSAHPLHQEAARLLAPLKRSRACVDYQF